MHYKNFFSSTALVTLLSLSSAAFSDPVGPISDEETGYYVRLQYNGEFSPFKTKIDNIIVRKDNAAVTNVDPFKASFLAGSGAFGYKMDDIRVDIEALYSQLNKNIKTGITTDPEVADSLTAFSGLVNVYYDVAIEDMPITPYVGVGVGATYIKNPLATKVTGDKDSGFGFAWQAKAGVSYDINSEIRLFAGTRYFGSYGAKFDRPGTATDAAAAGGQQPVKDGLKVLYSTIGAEAGLMFNF